MAKTQQIHKVLSSVLEGLDDDAVLDYLVSIVEETTPEDDLSEILAPFLLSTGFVDDDDEAEKLCVKIQQELNQGMGETWQAQTQQGLEVKKLDNTLTMEQMAQEIQDDELMNMMWGFDKIRKITNEQVDHKVAQSQRQIRKQIKVDKIQEERERLEIEQDMEWEDARVLPDLSHNTGEKDIHVDNVNISFKGLTLLTDTSLKFVNGRCYGLIGHNGTGKTTLLRYISRYEVEGFPRHVRIQHVAQESAEKLSTANKSVLQVVLDSDYERLCLLEEEQQLLTQQDDQSQNRLKVVYDRLAEIDADTAESRARIILKGLQFTNEMIDGPAGDLSGGWRMRAALSGALFMCPDLLLLDEPTNHLDLEAVMWLENYLQTYEKTVVIVSHDRSFLNSVITDVIHLFNQKLTYYRGDYNSFENTRKESLRQQRKAYEAQQQKIAHMQEFIDRFRTNAKKAPLVQSRVKMLEKMELIEEPEDEQAFRMQFPPPEPLGRPIIAVTDITFGYKTSKTGHAENDEGDDDAVEMQKQVQQVPAIPLAPIFRNVNFSIDMESRIGILGRNGSGKSTLVNLILDKLKPDMGNVHRNSRLRIACFTQHHVDQLNLSKSAVENMMSLFPGHESQEFRTHLGRFKVSGNMATKATRKLSGGQKSRVAFAILTWTLPHVIIMDEPTNHLDIDTIDALIDALKAYTGGVLIVSHDQHFVNSICNELWVVEDGAVTRFRGSVSDYRKKVLH